MSLFLYFIYLKHELKEILVARHLIVFRNFCNIFKIYFNSSTYGLSIIIKSPDDNSHDQEWSRVIGRGKERWGSAKSGGQLNRIEGNNWLVM